MRAPDGERGVGMRVGGRLEDGWLVQPNRVGSQASTERRTKQSVELGAGSGAAEVLRRGQLRRERILHGADLDAYSRV